MLTVVSHELEGEVWRMVLAERDELDAREGAIDLGPPRSMMDIVFAAEDERWADLEPAEAKALQLAEVRAAWAPPSDS